MAIHVPWGLAIVLVIAINHNISSARIVSPYNRLEIAMRKDQTTVGEPPRFSLLGTGQNKFNQLSIATREETQQTEGIYSESRYARDYPQQPEALLKEPSAVTIYDISRSSLGGQYNRKMPILRNKRGYSICDIKHPSIFEILEFLRKRKLCGMKTGYFRFGIGK